MSRNQVPAKIILKSTTHQTLNDRFADIARRTPKSPPQVTVTGIRTNQAQISQASAKNRRLAAQMAQRTGLQDVMSGGQKQSLQSRLGSPRGRGMRRGLQGRIGVPAVGVGSKAGMGFRRGGLGSSGRGRGLSKRGRGVGRGGFGKVGRGSSVGHGAGRFGAGGSRGGRGRGRGVAGRGRGRGRGRGNVSKDKLDAELDQYMSKTKTHLDQELDNYMMQAGSNED